MRVIEVLSDCGHIDTLRGIAEHNEIMDCWASKSPEEERCSVKLLVRPEKQQVVLDAIQQALTASQDWRIVMHPVEKRTNSSAYMRRRYPAIRTAITA